MANENRPFGLKPIRYKNGAPYTGSFIACYVEAGYGTALFVGDPVVKVAGGSNAAAVTAPGAGRFPIGTLPSVEKATAGASNRVSGVIVGFAPLPTDLSKNYNPASTARVAYVCMDPDVVFEIQANGAITATQVGLNAIFIYTQSGSTTTGLSGVELDTSGTAPAVTATFNMRILAAVNREDNDTTITRAKVEVVLNNHTEAHGNTANGDGTLGV